MTVYTPDALVRDVQGRVRLSKVTMDQAYAQMAAEIAADPAALAGWWDLFGSWWLQASYRVAMGADIDSLPLFGQMGEDELPAARAPRKQRANWMLDLNPFNVIVPVADTGRKKRVGDFDAEDARAFEAMFRAQMHTADKLRRGWAKVVELLGTEHRLEDVHDRVPVLDLGLFPPTYVEKVRAAGGAGAAGEERRAA